MKSYEVASCYVETKEDQLEVCMHAMLNRIAGNALIVNPKVDGHAFHHGYSHHAEKGGLGIRIFELYILPTL